MTRRISIAVACVLAATFACFSGPNAEAQAYGEAVGPPGPPPQGVPPPPPDSLGGVPSGQWVYTQQYGWIWMTDADQYTYVPPNGSGEPLEYVYYGDYGWTWLSAPWVWGLGPSPWFGRTGPRRFAWYQHGYWRTPRRWHYAGPPPERGRVAGGAFRPAPTRSGRRPEAQPRREEPRREQPRGERREGGEHRGSERRGGGERQDGGEGHGGAFSPERR